MFLRCGGLFDVFGPFENKKQERQTIKDACSAHTSCLTRAFLHGRLFFVMDRAEICRADVALNSTLHIEMAT